MSIKNKIDIYSTSVTSDMKGFNLKIGKNRKKEIDHRWKKKIDEYNEKKMLKKESSL